MPRSPVSHKSASAPAVAPDPAKPRRQRVQAAATGVAVLKALARLGGRAGLGALAAEVDEHPAKVHRYLASFVEECLVCQDAASQQYYLGPEAILIGVTAMRQADPVRVGEPALVRLREQLGLTCFLAVMGNKGPTIVRFEEPVLPVTVNVRVGSVMSLLWSATGRVFLGLRDDAAMLAQARAELEHSSPERRASLDADDPLGTLRREIRAHRMVVIRDVYLPGISAVSAPLYDVHGAVCAVLTVLGASGSFDASPDGPVAQAVWREAQTCSVLLGHGAGVAQRQR
ncbi:IclR family transcriptional regulator [Thiomonas sp.]|uniref:IclR family transcriptional regulator n=1 Tax=Thiomonas sp. TaxID=2047785 RepID=UPI0026037FD5|nr:IclR family transcriptional regulator [Thiomonas sp.]